MNGEKKTSFIKWYCKEYWYIVAGILVLLLAIILTLFFDFMVAMVILVAGIGVALIIMLIGGIIYLIHDHYTKVKKKWKIYKEGMKRLYNGR